MPNYCSYNMKVKGEKQNVEEFIKIMKANYNYRDMKFDFERHMGGRVFDAVASEIECENDKHYSIITGSCAWSVSACMRENGYYKDFKNDYKDMCRSTTLAIESERLNLKIEVVSTEPGMCFAEHYIFNDGDLICEECVDYNEYPIYEFENKEDAEKEYDIEISDTEWKSHDYVCRGGFDIEWSI